MYVAKLETLIEILDSNEKIKRNISTIITMIR